MPRSAASVNGDVANFGSPELVTRTPRSRSSSKTVGWRCRSRGAIACLNWIIWASSPVSGLRCVYPVMPVSPGQVPVPNVDMAATVVLGAQVEIGRWLAGSFISDRR